jgi:hypothetical protein
MRNAHKGPAISFWTAVAKMPPGLAQAPGRFAEREIKSSKIIML